jgi:hypothetical protein
MLPFVATGVAERGDGQVPTGGAYSVRVAALASAEHSTSACDGMNRSRCHRRTYAIETGGGNVTEEEQEGVELLLSDPEIIAWLELDDSEEERE